MPAQESETDLLKLGSLLVVYEEEPASPLPLEGTTVSGSITGMIAVVRVTQRFGNPFKTPVELEYLFPLPHKAAVVDYGITIGTRHIRAEIKEADVARQVYDAAVQAGQRASLLEQRRPNMFAVRIGNVQPGETIVCELVYEDRLKFEDGAYEFVFPMGITPRYHSPAQSTATAESADAPFAGSDEPIAPVEISLSVDAGVGVEDPTSPSHPLKVERGSEHALTVSLGASETPHVPNKDFVLRYRLTEGAASAVQSALWTTPDVAANGAPNGDSEIGLLMLIPPRLSADLTIPPREFIFVLDRSGSMSTHPMNQARNAAKACLRALSEKDTFTFQAFDDKIEWFSEKALPITQANVDAADAWLDTIASRGGTQIIPAIEAALALPVDSGRMRYVVFLTDGSVSADEQAISKIARERGTARIFTFGIGPSVNRFLLDKFAELGRGSVEFIGAHEPIEPSLARFQNRVSYPALRDVALSGQNVDFWDIYPSVLPDLYVDQPLEVATRLKRRDGAAVQISGEVGGVTRHFQVVLPAPAGSDAVRRLWARARIESLLDQQRSKRTPDEGVRQQIISIALEYRLATRYTSFVAVDSEVTTGGDAQKVRVSLPLPEGLDFENFFGSMAAVGGAAHFAPAAAPMQAQSVVHGIVASSDLRMRLRKEAALDDQLNDALFDESSPSTGAGKSGRILGRFMRRQSAGSPEPDAAMQSEGEAFDSQWDAPSLDQLTTPSPTLDEQVQTLARNQKINGSWKDDIEATAQALLLFIRAGHTTRAGSYRPQVQKAAAWLKAAAVKTAAGAQDAALKLAHEALQALTDATGDDWMPSGN